MEPRVDRGASAEGPPGDRYVPAAIALHWIIALLLAFQIGMGHRMTDAPPSGATFAAFQLHKSLGMLVLVLSVARLVLKLTRCAPPPVAGGVGGLLARLVHAGFYAVMIGGPLTGWALVSSARIAVPTRLFGAIPLPHLPLAQSWNGVATALHGQIAWLGVGLFALHVAGALRHHLAPGGAAVVGRMIPGAAGRGRSVAAAGGAVALVLLAAASPWRMRVPAPRAATPPAPVPAAPAPARSSPAALPTPTPTPAPSATPTEAAATPVAASRWTVLPGGRLGFTARMNGV